MARTLLLASDLDHTMVQNEDKIHHRLLAFNHQWLSSALSPSSGHQKLLVFSTGRSPELFMQLWSEAPLIAPDVLICSVGSEIFYNTASPVPRALLSSAQQATPLLDLSSSQAPCAHPLGMPQGPEFLPDYSWESFLDVGWDRPKASELVAKHFPMLKPQVASEQRSHKISYNIDPSTLPGGRAEATELMAQLQKLLKDEHNINAKVIYSGGRDVDVLSAAAGKGRGLSFLLQRLKDSGFEPANVQVAGDSGNDIELFLVPGVKGCVVSNAHPELRAFAEAQAAKGGADHICQATEPCAGGILQALHHFGLLQSPKPTAPLAPSPASGTSHQLLSHGAPGAVEAPTAAATALQHAAAVPTDAESTGVADQQVCQWLLLSGEAGAREFAWRLGTALSKALREGVAPSDLLHHSALRLLIANDCNLVLHPPAPHHGRSKPPASSGSANAVGEAKGADAAAIEIPQELPQDLQPVAIVAAADHCNTSTAWIDELVAVQVAESSTNNSGVVPGEEAALQQEALAASACGALPGGSGLHLGPWKLRFKVYCLSRPTGTRDEMVHEVETVVHQQTHPVPHGFLAKAINVWGPFELQQVLPRIHSRLP